jgi:radical SAM-linked protein
MRSKIPLKYSQGFHPKPKISFNDPLPVGIESQYESFVMTVPDCVRPETVPCSLNVQLPDGLSVLSCQPAPSAFPNDAADPINYMITLKEGNFDKDKLSSYLRNPDVNITISNRKGKLKKINLKDMVVNIDLLDSFNLRLTLSSGKTKTVRPAQILHHIFNLAEKQIKQAKIVKLKAQGREHRA